MNRLSLRLVKAYLLLVLLAASSTSVMPYSILPLVLLMGVIFISFRTLRPGLSLVASVALLFLLPLVVALSLGYVTSLPPVALGITAAASALPVMYLFDDSLRQNAQLISPLVGEAEGRHVSNTFMHLLVSALIMLFLSFVLGNLALLFAAAIFTMYLAGILARVLLAIPPHPFGTPMLWRRVIAGGTIDISPQLVNRASLSLHSLISPVNEWVKAAPRRFVLSGKAGLSITITPPLAGPSRPRLRISAHDPWGLIQVDQLIEPVELHVIPRARYAEWLAMRYLEQAKTGVFGAAAMAARTIIMPKRGIEYHDSRAYQPGDQLRDIDWKHSAKLNQLIIKEYVEGGKQAAIIAVNLSVSGTEQADKLAFNLITAALTLAEEGIPTALAAYNQQRVVLTLPITDAREILRQALSLIKEIKSMEFADRHLELPDFGRLRQNMARLKESESEAAQRLLGILDFEIRAIEYAAQDHPANLALSPVTERMSGPAMILLISGFNHDAEALAVATEKLSRREFTFISLSDKP